MSHTPDDPRDLLRWELAQRREAGYRLDGPGEAAASAVADPDAKPDALLDLLAELEATGRPETWAQDEPEDLPAILAGASAAPPSRLDDRDLQNRVLGGWLGRCAGNQLGKPVASAAFAAKVCRSAAVVLGCSAWARSLRAPSIARRRASSVTMKPPVVLVADRPSAYFGYA
jgi:hypothetical protein